MLNERIRMTEAEWNVKGAALFGDDQMEWEFVCPVCGHVARVKDWKEAGATSGAAAFSCVGRWLDGAREAFGGKNAGKKRPGPCNYAGGGLIGLNPVCVVDGDGVEHDLFAFNEVKNA